MKKLILFLIKLQNLFYGVFCKSIFVGQYTTNRNYGDALNLLLLTKLFSPMGYKIIPLRYVFEKYYCKQENLQFIGSIINGSDTNRYSIIWGAGIISKDTMIKELPRKIFAVRGPLTRELLLKQGCDCPEVYGDPALLMPRFYNKKNTKTEHKIGFIPHYEDINKEKSTAYIKEKDVHFINIMLSKSRLTHPIFSEYKDFIDGILSCEVIVSSSLHGLILGDAYKKPTLWVKMGDDVMGNDFKFYDYYASMGIDSQNIEPIDLRNYDGTLTALYEKATLKPVEKIDMDLFLAQNPYKNGK